MWAPGCAVTHTRARNLTEVELWSALVRRVLELLFVGAAVGCATHGPESLSFEIVDRQPDTLESLNHQPHTDHTEADVDDDAPLECLPEGSSRPGDRAGNFVARPPAIPSYAPEPSTGKCWSAPKSVRTGVAIDVRSKYMDKETRIDFDFGCDRLGEIEEVIVQSGAGHGGTLDLMRLRAAADGDWDVLLLRASAGYYSDYDELPAGTYRGRLSAKQVRTALDTARTAMLIHAAEVAPDDDGGSFSSADLHAFVRLIDARGRARSVAFTGYISSDDQLGWIVPSMAAWQFDEFIDEDLLALAAPDDDSRTFFMERFAEAEARDYYGEFGGWWVHRRLLMMAGTQASLDLLPSLGLRLCPGHDVDHERSADEALIAMFALLGRSEEPEFDKDLRLDAGQAARWIEACGIACPSSQASVSAAAVELEDPVEADVVE